MLDKNNNERIVKSDKQKAENDIWSYVLPDMNQWRYVINTLPKLIAFVIGIVLTACSVKLCGVRSLTSLFSSSESNTINLSPEQFSQITYNHSDYVKRERARTTHEARGSIKQLEGPLDDKPLSQQTCKAHYKDGRRCTSKSFNTKGLCGKHK